MLPSRLAFVHLNSHGIVTFYRQYVTAGSFAISDAADSRSITGDALDRLIAGTVNRLRVAGLGPGDRVMFIDGQGISVFVHFWATVLLGGIFVPLDTTWPCARIASICLRMRPTVAVVPATSLAGFQTLLPDLLLLSANELASGQSTFIPAEMPAGAAAAFLLTSGSTGEPKIVVHGRDALLRSARLAVETFDWRDGERLLNLPEPHTMSGLRNAMLAAPLAGMTWVSAAVEQRSNLFALLDLLATHRIQRLVAAPMLLRQVNLQGARLSLGTLAGLKAIYCTGADLHIGEVDRFHARYGIPVINYYGLTETVGLCLSQRIEGWQPGDRSLGWPVGCRVRLMTGAGQEAKGDITGELQIEMPLPMQRYLDEPVATAQRFDGQWLRTGDLACRDNDGRITLTGRASAFINTVYTEKVYPGEVESALEQLPGIAQAAVFGLPDAAGGERIAALIVPLSDASQEELAPQCLALGVRKILGPSRVPVAFRCVDDLPRSSNGKLVRHALAAIFAHAH